MPGIENHILLGTGVRIQNVPTVPGAGTDAVNADYVDGKFGQLAWKDNAFAASPSNVNIASPGATIDGQTMTLAQPRVLLPNQTTGSENGLYNWNGASVPMTRTDDANTFEELRNAVVSIDNGTNYSGVRFRQIVMSGTLGTTSLTWQIDATAAPAASTTQAGISRHATQQEVNAGAALSPNVTLTADTAFNASWRVKQATGTFGDGSSTAFTLTHNLNTLYPVVTISRTTGNRAKVFPDIESPTANTITVTYASGNAPATNSMFATVIGATI